MLLFTFIIYYVFLAICKVSEAAYPHTLTNVLLSLRGSGNLPDLSDLTRFKSFSCTNRDDGAYPDVQSHCYNYYRCLGGSVFSYVCPLGMKFDYDEKECMPEDAVKCSPDSPVTTRCQDQTDGFYPDYNTNCQDYYRCKDGVLLSNGSCLPGTIWDLATSSCWSSRRASCSAPSCFGLPDGPHPVPGSKCAAYFTCQDGYRTDNVCAFGTSFDYVEKKCVSNSKSVCYEHACEGRVNGLHAMPSAPCDAYFRCFNAALVEVDKCPDNYLFNGYECVKAHNYTCSSGIGASCSDRKDGFYRGDDEECKGFFLCRQSKLVRSFKCSSGLMFNGEECVDDQNSICSSRPRLPDCSTKYDGYYTFEKTQCRSFYHCENRRKISEHTCPGDFIFNGKQCVDPLLHPCKETNVEKKLSNRSRFTRRTNNCLNPNGYQLDMINGCSRFYECSNGRKVSTHACPEGSLFSGSKCVLETNYECPIVPNSLSCTYGDGVYYETNNPSDYFSCHRGLKSSFKCPVDMVFDGLRCTPRISLLNYY